MIQSMTGYGKAVAVAPGRKVIVEIKSLNSKAMDISTRIPQSYREHELDIRSRITAALERGKVDFSIYFDQTAQSAQSAVNVAMFQAYLEQLRQLSAATGVAVPDDVMSVILRMPDVMASAQQVEEVSEEEWELVSKAVDQAIAALVDYRKTEGAALEAKFREKIGNISELLPQVEPFEKDRVAKIKERMRQSLDDAVGARNVDQNRFEQEMIFYIEKLDISEEKQRLTNHLNYFLETLDDGHGQGKKLGFIAQEMGREINTLGSKSNQAEMQNIVVRMKDELEQIKEQVLNAM
ncbi:MAG: YicC family protein [Bacteroidaceae bacterium]|nr:YicC family protein [Bacteroidaceae bacterium]